MNFYIENQFATNTINTHKFYAKYAKILDIYKRFLKKKNRGVRRHLYSLSIFLAERYSATVFRD